MTFFEKYELLKKSIPVPAVANDAQSVGCDYSDGMIASKNCFFCEGTFQEDCIYAFYSAHASKLVDCLQTSQSERCYECVSCLKCHNCTYLIDCNNNTDCHFSALLNSCNDCFGCVGLSNKKYCILNNQLTKDQYERAVKEIRKELGWKS